MSRYVQTFWLVLYIPVFDIVRSDICYFVFFRILCVLFLLLGITALLGLETQEFHCTCHNIVKFVYTTNELWFDFSALPSIP